MNAAVERAVAAGDYPQGLANLQRLAASRAVPLNDPRVMRRTDEVWGLYLHGHLTASRTAGLERVATLTQLIQFARSKSAAGAAASLMSEQDRVLDEWMASRPGPLSARLAAGRTASIVAGASPRSLAIVEPRAGRPSGHRSLRDRWHRGQSPSRHDARSSRSAPRQSRCTPTPEATRSTSRATAVATPPRKFVARLAVPAHRSSR